MDAGREQMIPLYRRSRAVGQIGKPRLGAGYGNDWSTGVSEGRGDPAAQATAGADDECDLSFDVHEVVPPSDTDAAAWMIHGQ